MKAQHLAIAAGAFVVVLGGIWVWRKGLEGAAEAAAKAAANLAKGAATGAVKGVANIAGIPDTNAGECKKAIADGRLWDASFACPAGDFLKAGGSAFFAWFQPKPRSGFTWSDAEAQKSFEEQERLFGR